MQYTLEMKNITKVFPGIIANDDVSIYLKKQEVLALLGENGAGKSTLMSVLFGMYKPEKGGIYINGEEVKILDPNDANKYKIGMVHQHFKLVGVFSALENIVLGVEPTKSGGVLNMVQARKKVEELVAKYKLEIDPDMRVNDMTVGMQQRVEILKMLYRENDILIFDEPTAVLTPQEIVELMSIMHRLVEEGKSIIFISHKLNEVMEVADRCTVLRLGKAVGDIEVKDATPEILSEMMVGRKVSLIPDKPETKLGEVVLKTEKLSVRDPRTGKDAVKDVSFEVRAGEIVCIAGIDGNGQSELAYGITGLQKITGGKLVLAGEDVTHAKTRERIINGISHIPEDRQKHGLVMDYTMMENAILQNYYLPEYSQHGIINYKRANEYTDELIEKFDVRSARGKESIVRTMSGGNQQKLIIGREVTRNPKVLVTVQPTRGLDIGAISEIQKELIAERDKGMAVLLISLELDEVMNLSDRILVMYEGEIVGEFKPQETTFQELGLYMAGAKRQQDEVAV